MTSTLCSSSLIQTASKGRAVTKIRESVLLEKYEKVPAKQAQLLWTAEWAAAETERVEQVCICVGVIVSVSVV